MNKEKIVPKIRFKEFSNNWVKCKLGEVSDISSGGTPSRGESSYWNGDIPWATTAEVKYSEITDTKEKITIDGLNNSSAKLMPVGTILLAMYGQGKTRGQLGILSIEAATNQANANIQVHRYIYNYFVYYQLVKKYNLLRNLANEGGQANLSLGIVKSVNIVVTNNLDEQLKIGEFFKQLDNIITLQQQLLDDHKQLKKAMLQKMFPQKGESVPRIRFAGFTDNWENKEIKDMFEVTRGKVLAATKVLNKKTKQFQYPVYSSQTKNNGLLGFYKEYLFDTAITWTTDGANAGTVNFREGKFYSTNVNGVLLSKEGYANKAVSEILNRVAWKFVSKVGNPKLMNNIMSDISIVVPSLEEQLKISKFFNQLDETIALHENKLETYQELKKAMLQKMFV